MSILITTLILVVVFGLAVLASGRFGQVETYSISTRELPNVAADLGTTDTDSAHL
jgi:hypothetical protein